MLDRDEIRMLCKLYKTWLKTVAIPQNRVDESINPSRMLIEVKNKLITEMTGKQTIAEILE